MKKLFSMFRKSDVSLNTEFARARLIRTMPGETGALSANRYGSHSL